MDNGSYATDQIVKYAKDRDVEPGQRVLITDDLLATGGTIEAAIKLVEN